jgi:hypothetical protein
MIEEQNFKNGGTPSEFRMLRTLLTGFAVVVTLIDGSALAQPPFKKYFDRKYFTNDSAMRKTYTTSTCNFCHYAGPDGRKHRTDYGQTLARLLSKEDADNLSFKVRIERPEVYKKAEQKVLQALEAIEKEPSNPQIETSPTFGDLLRRGKLPIALTPPVTQ